MNKLLTIIITSLALMGCAINPNIQNVIGPPDQVQAEVTALGAIGKIYVPQSDVPQLHQFGSALASCTTINSTILLGLIPHTGHPKTDAIITAAAAFVTLALTRFSTTDPVTLQYAHAVGNGLLTNF